MGTSANFPGQYATKRCRSNRINWGMTPFLVQNPEAFAPGDYIFVPGIRKAILEKNDDITACAVKPDGTVTKFKCSVVIPAGVVPGFEIGLDHTQRILCVRCLA